MGEGGQQMVAVMRTLGRNLNEQNVTSLNGQDRFVNVTDDFEFGVQLVGERSQ